MIPSPPKLRYDWTLDQRLALSVDEAAFTLGFSRSFLEEAIAAGEINVARRGRRMIIPVSALKRFLGSLTVKDGGRVPAAAQRVRDE